MPVDGGAADGKEFAFRFQTTAVMRKRNGGAMINEYTANIGTVAIVVRCGAPLLLQWPFPLYFLSLFCVCVCVFLFSFVNWRWA